MITKENMILMLGLSIGDGSIQSNTSRHKGSFSTGHSLKQEEYCLHKKMLLEEMLGRKIKPYYHTNKKGYKKVAFSISHKYFRLIRQWLYPKEKKYLSREILDKLDNRAVAYWYMDDGSLYSKKRLGKIHAFELVFSTCCTEQEAENAISFFAKRYDIIFTIKRNKGKCSVRCGTRAAKILLNIIQQHIIPSMRYKTFDRFAHCNV